MKNLLNVVLISFAIILSSCSQKPEFWVKTDKNNYKGGESITVTFQASPDWAEDAWIGIIPSNIAHGKEAVNDEHDIDYQHLNKKVNGTLKFTAPEESGSYDIRMHDTDGEGLEIASVTFVVK